ncbi:hypothetical protein KY308_02205 [Candidatus Woesearchaeota archaeon]|nr:hypothetical protein [Candidatus Woesearchaeota archaeon]
MSKIFVDDGRKIRVEQFDKDVMLSLHDFADIFPALHYVESHPEIHPKGFGIQKVENKIIPADGEELEEFKPELIKDKAENTYGYKNYNFILLNSAMEHSVEGIVRDFAKFLSEIRNPRRRKVKIKDVPLEAFDSLLRIAEMKKKYGRRDFHYKTFNEGDPARSMYLYAEKFSRGLKNRMGLEGRFKNSHLDERLYF